MSVITPNTDVILLKVPLEISDDHQLTFANATAQFNYFNGLTGKIELENFTYSRKDGLLRVPYGYDDVFSYNYVMYRNTSYSSKWFYAFITGYEYLNDGATALSIKTDVWQTYQFDLTYKKCLVEREHVNDDTIGVNTIPEGLELGEYTINGSSSILPSNTVKDKYNNAITATNPIWFQVTSLASGISIAASAFQIKYNGIFSGMYLFAVADANAARAVIDRYNQYDSPDNIIAIFLAPKEFLQGAEVFGELGYNIYIPQKANTLSTLLPATTYARPTKVDGYTPKNNKLFVYPYSYVSIDNNVGTTTEYHYEDFTSATPEFYMGGAIGQGCNIKLCPVHYKGSQAEVFNYGITGAKYPICGWACDYYTNWCTQNAVNIPLQYAGAVTNTLSTFQNIAEGKGNTGIPILSTAFDIMAQRYAAKLHPDQARGNSNLSDILPGWQRYYTLDKMSIKAEYARSIDEYFSAFGYKVNRIKTPNVTGRRNWNFVKTAGCYITADIPQEDLQEIKSLFDKGITLWHNPSTFLDYSQTNDIIS